MSQNVPPTGLAKRLASGPAWMNGMNDLTKQPVVKPDRANGAQNQVLKVSNSVPSPKSTPTMAQKSNNVPHPELLPPKPVIPNQPVLLPTMPPTNTSAQINSTQPLPKPPMSTAQNLVNGPSTAQAQNASLDLNANWNNGLKVSAQVQARLTKQQAKKAKNKRQRNGQPTMVNGVIEFQIPAEVEKEPQLDDDKAEDQMAVAETYADYKPAKLNIGNAHPDAVVETASLSSVEPTDITYDLKIPHRIIKKGLLSALQLESIVYASQAHEHLLPDGSRAGFLIGECLFSTCFHWKFRITFESFVGGK